MIKVVIIAFVVVEFVSGLEVSTASEQFLHSILVLGLLGCIELVAVRAPGDGVVGIVVNVAKILVVSVQVHEGAFDAIVITSRNLYD